MNSSSSPSVELKQNCRTLAIANQKGGVGKTTTAINLSAALAAAGYKTLMIDLDPQGNASTGLGIDPAERVACSSALLFADRPVEALATKVPALEIIPASEDLLVLMGELPSQPHPAFVFAPALAALAQKDYHFIIIDCPPGLNILTLNALTAVDGVIVPLQSEFFALEGLSQILKTLEDIRQGANEALNPRLELEGVLLTMVDPRNNLALQVLADARENLGHKVFETIIPRNVRLSEAPSHGLPALVYDHRSLGAQAYIALAGELLKRIAERPAQAA